MDSCSRSIVPINNRLGHLDVQFREIESEIPICPPLFILINKIQVHIYNWKSSFLKDKSVVINKLLEQRAECDQSLRIKTCVGYQLSFSMICAVYIQSHSNKKHQKLKHLRLISTNLVAVRENSWQIMLNCSSQSRQIKMSLALNMTFHPIHTAHLQLLQSVPNDINTLSRHVDRYKERLDKKIITHEEHQQKISASLELIELELKLFQEHVNKIPDKSELKLMPEYEMAAKLLVLLRTLVEHLPQVMKVDISQVEKFLALFASTVVEREVEGSNNEFTEREVWTLRLASSLWFFEQVVNICELSNKYEKDPSELQYLHKAFSVYDDWLSNEIKTEDLPLLLQDLEIELKENEFHSFIEELDVDRVGTVCFIDFVDWYYR